MKLIIFWFLLIVSQIWSADLPFSRGINLGVWFEESSAQEIEFTKFTKQDFINIKSMGADVIRLPINLFHMTSGEPEYTVDPLFYFFLDQVIDWAEELEMHLILDNHTFDFTTSPVPDVEQFLIPVWTQMADHYKSRTGYLYYEILNEPHNITDSLWNTVQQNVINAIRTVDQTHTIIVSPANWGNVSNLNLLPDYDDDNLIYTFHFYDPFLFTHQGASWTSPSLEPLGGVPFEYREGSMPECPEELVGTWIEGSFNNYSSEGTIQYIQDRIDIAADFQQERNVPLLCGEFGVFRINCEENDRLLWHNTVSSYLETKGIAWTLWSYGGGFGIFEEGTEELFDHDLNIPLIEALGFFAPPQTELSIEPDTTGFIIYRDYLESNTFESSPNFNGTLNFYYEDSPKSGDFCIYWSDADHYDYISLDFRPDRDLSFLAGNNYLLDFWVRCNSSGTSFDVRFLDSKTDDPDDHPWRMFYTINENIVDWNGEWEHVRIPLDQFTEQGSWDDGWHNPIGAFDWTAINRLEIVAESGSMSGIKISIDDIRIIQPSLILLTSPNGGEKWNVGSQHNITWSSQEIENVKIEYSVDNGNSWNLIAASTPASTGSFSWQVPDVDSENCVIRISDAENESISDLSDNKFSIAHPAITVVSPNGDEEWQVGSLQSISWTCAHVERISIEYSVDNGVSWQQISDDESAASCCYDWTVPDAVSDNCSIKIASKSDINIQDTNDGLFSIVSVTNISSENIIPSENVLFDNFPNPFNPSTLIKFGIKKPGDINISIFNSLGQLVCTLADRYYNAGYHEVVFYKESLETEVTSGVYYYKIEASDFIQVKKMIILK